MPKLRLSEIALIIYRFRIVLFPLIVIYFIAAFGGSVFVVAQARHASSPPQPAGSTALSGTLDDFLKRAEGFGFSGSVLVARGEKVVFRRGYGFADRRRGIPDTPETVFDIASLDKQFIAAAILKLEEMGRLKTSDTLGSFFDFVPADKREITLNQMLSHTSGLENEYWDSFPKLNRPEFVRLLLTERKLESAPGSEWNYSNSGYIILEEIIERVSGKHYEDFLRHAVFKPAGLTQTGMPSANWKGETVARQQFWTLPDWTLSGVNVSDPLTRPRPMWMMLSTVDDLYKWHLALRTGRILNEESRKKLFTPVMEDYGYGWNIVKTTRGTRLIHHGGSDSTLGMMATFRWFADEDTFVAILSNSANPTIGADYFCANIENIIFGGAANFPPQIDSGLRMIDKNIVGQYEFKPGETVDIAILRNKQAVIRTRSKEIMAALIFPDSISQPADVPQDDALIKVIYGVPKSDFESLRKVVKTEQSFESSKASLQNYWKNWTSKLGDFQNAQTVRYRYFEFAGAPETQTFIRIRFARGDVYVRAIRFMTGGVGIRPFNWPDEVEFPMAPIGNRKFAVWDFTRESGAAINFPIESGHNTKLSINGKYGTIVAGKIARN